MPGLKPIVLAAALFVAGPAIAQEHPGKPAPNEPQQPAPRPPARSEVGPTVSVEFPGGTVEQYVETLRRASSGQANIVMPPRVAKATMPAVSLKSVTVWDALNAITAVADIPKDEDWGVRPLASLNMGGMPTSPDSIPGFAIVVQSRGFRAMAPGMVSQASPGSVRTEVYAIRDLLETGMKPEAILTAMDTALRMDQRTEPVDMKFHEESGLLILRASSDQLDAARQVVLQLRETAKSAARARSAQDRQKQMERLTAEINDLYRQQEAIKLEYYSLKDAASVAESERIQVQGRNDSPENLAKARERASQAQRAVVEAGFRNDRVERDLRSREHMLEQLRSMDQGGGGGGPDEIARLRAENAELRSRLEKLEEKKGR